MVQHSIYSMLTLLSHCQANYVTDTNEYRSLIANYTHFGVILFQYKQAMPAVAQLLAGPFKPDRSRERGLTKKHSRRGCPMASYRRMKSVLSTAKKAEETSAKLGSCCLAG